MITLALCYIYLVDFDHGIPINLLRLIEEHYSFLEPLLQADPLLLLVLVYICPQKQLTHLVKRIPLYISASWVSYLLKKDYYRYVSEFYYCSV